MREAGYRTLREAASASFIEKKSQFIGHGSPARSQAEALDFLRQIRREHPEASHNCWAYVVGRNEGIMRHSDDGEPGGTAGLPILETIRQREVRDCCVVVTRYFGGVLLGAGGLARAYAKGARLALDAARVLMMEDSLRFWLGVDYPLWDRVAHFLRDAPVRHEGTDFAATVTATLLIRLRDRDALFAALASLTDGKADLMEVERLPWGWEE